MKKIIGTIIALVVMMSGFVGLTIATASTAQAATGASDSSVVMNEVLKASAKFKGKSKKVKACKAYAAKLEQQAPPEDPQALCKGKVKVVVKGKVAQSCPAGYFGGSAQLSVKIVIKAKARAFAKSIASGRVQTWASTKIKVHLKVTGKTTLECVKIPETPVTYETPSVDVSPIACINPGEKRDVTVTASNPNNVADTARLTFRGQTTEKAIAAHGQTTFTFTGVGAGSYSGTALLVTAGKSKSFTVTVENCPPVEYPAPMFMQFREFNDFYKSLPGTPVTMDHCVTVDFPEGHSGEVFWTAELGSFATPRKAAQDGVQVCSTYTAPSEAGHDTITVTATDSVSGKSVTKTSRAFVIKEWPAIP